MSVVHTNFAFEPERLSFSVGETITFELSSADDTHTFTVEDLDIDWRVRGGEEPQTQTHTFDSPGTFELICTISGHRALGMEGTITVQ